MFRSAGMYLLAQYFRQQAGQESDMSLAGLKANYENLHLLNTMMAKRIKNSTKADSAINAVIFLDMFTNLMPFAIEENLAEIRHLFEDYFRD